MIREDDVRRMMAAAAKAGDYELVVSLLGRVCDLRDLLRSPNARRQARHRERHKERSQDAQTRNEVTQPVTPPSAVGDVAPSPLSDSPLSGTSLSDQKISDFSSVSGSLREGSGLEQRVAAAPAKSEPGPASAATSTAVLPGDLEPYFRDEVASLAMHGGRPLDANDLWERFQLWVEEKATVSANWRATAKRWLRDRLKFDRIDAERSRGRGPSVQAPREIPSTEGPKRWQASTVKLDDVLREGAK